MKFIPILYSTPMVQAINEDRKTKTRRTKGLEFINESCSNWEYLGVDELGHLMRNDHGATNAIKCPYGQPGDIHWVRENWRIKYWGFDDGDFRVEYQAGGTQLCDLPEDGDDWLIKSWEHAVAKGYLVPSAEDEEKFVFTDKEQPYKPSIHMPKSACRTWLQVTNVRIERLQDISEKDAIAEGIDYVIDKITGYCGFDYIYRTYNTMTTPYHGFRSLWRKINGEQSWNANPWVWVIEFKKVEKPEGFC